MKYILYIMSSSEEDFIDDGDYDVDEVDSVDGGAVEVSVESDEESLITDDTISDDQSVSSEESYYSSEEEIEEDDTDKVIDKLTKEKRSKLSTEEKSRYYIKKVYNKHMALIPSGHSVANHKKITIVPNDERITSNTISIYEAAELISHRAKQIEEGCKNFTPIEDQVDTTSSIDKALEEFKMRMTPLLIMRQVEVGKVYEIWDPKLMDFPAELNITL